MPITKRAIENDNQWKMWRGGLVGASETGALFPGSGHYMSPFELYQLKSGNLQITETKVMRDGRKMEKVALELIQEEYPELKAYNPKVHYSDSEIGVGATPDAFAEDHHRGIGVIQIKWIDRDNYRKWHDVPPLWMALQVTQEAWLSGASWGVICALVQDHGLNLHFHQVEIRDDVIAAIRKEVQEFWRRVREEDPPAPDYSRDADIIRAAFPEDDGGEIDLTGDNELPELAAKYELTKGLAAANEKAARAIGAELLHKIGNHSIARFQGGYFTAKTVRRAAHEVKESVYRPLRVVSK